MTSIEAVPSVRDVPLLAGLDDALIGRLQEIAETRLVAAGTRLLRQGERPDHLHILLVGLVSLTAAAPRGATMIVDVVSPLDVFVLPAVLLKARYPVSAEAALDSRLLVIEAEALRSLMREEPSLARRFGKCLAEQCQKLAGQVTDLKLRSAAQRLGCFLLRLKEERPSGRQVSLPYDKRLLAGRIGTTPENLSRAFATLRRYGVETRGTTVLLHDPAGLAAYAAPDSG